METASKSGFAGNCATLTAWCDVLFTYFILKCDCNFPDNFFCHWLISSQVCPEQIQNCSLVRLGPKQSFFMICHGVSQFNRNYRVIIIITLFKSQIMENGNQNWFKNLKPKINLNHNMVMTTNLARFKNLQQ